MPGSYGAAWHSPGFSCHPPTCAQQCRQASTQAHARTLAHMAQRRPCRFPCTSKRPKHNVVGCAAELRQGGLLTHLLTHMLTPDGMPGQDQTKHSVLPSFAAPTARSTHSVLPSFATPIAGPTHSMLPSPATPHPLPDPQTERCLRQLWSRTQHLPAATYCACTCTQAHPRHHHLAQQVRQSGQRAGGPGWSAGISAGAVRAGPRGKGG